MSNLLMKLRNFMAGRNGVDKLTYGLLFIYFVIAAVNSFIRGFTVAWIVLSVIQYLFLAYIVFRVLSKNLQKRYNENYAFEKFINAWKPYFERMKLRFQYRKTHRFRVCSHCGEFLRLKKGRGKRKITCPKCYKELNFYFLF